MLTHCEAQTEWRQINSAVSFSGDEKPAETERTCEKETIPDVDGQDDMAEFRHVKAEMLRLGFETLEEYCEYLDFLEMKKTRKKNFEM